MSSDAEHNASTAASIDAAGLARFIRDRHLGDAADLRTENISFGHSNEVHLVHFDGKAWALRRPPRGPLLPTAHDVLREYRILDALQETGVPLPRVYAACDDSSYIGAPFYLMEQVRGSVIRSPNASSEKSFAATPAQRRAVSEGMVELLVALQAVDWRAAGLEKFGRPDGYLERQLRRWTDQLERTLPLTRPLPVMEQIRDWLKANLPSSPPATIVHGDFKLDNVMWDVAGQSPRPLALVDWEMSTLGDPLADLGWMLTYWTEPADSPARRAVVSSMDPEPGYLSRREMIDRYEAQAGRAVASVAFYEAFALFKLAIILEGSYARHLSGQADDPIFATYDVRVPTIAEAAWGRCQSGA